MVDFGDLDLFFKVTTALRNVQNRVSVRYHMNLFEGFLPNLHRYIVGGRGRVNWILATLN